MGFSDFFGEEEWVMRKSIGLLLAILWIFLTSAANAQVLYGTLTGNVADPSGALVPGAKVAGHVKEAKPAEAAEKCRQAPSSNRSLVSLSVLRSSQRFSSFLGALCVLRFTAPVEIL